MYLRSSFRRRCEARRQRELKLGTIIDCSDTTDHLVWVLLVKEEEAEPTCRTSICRCNVGPRRKSNPILLSSPRCFFFHEGKKYSASS